MEVYSKTATVEDAKLKTFALKDTLKSYYLHRRTTFEQISLILS